MFKNKFIKFYPFINVFCRTFFFRHLYSTTTHKI
nr:MAG TPA: hypothetical protein [Caudoviricetes sp.]